MRWVIGIGMGWGGGGMGGGRGRRSQRSDRLSERGNLVE